MYETEHRLRMEMIQVVRILADQGLIRSSDGNVSARLVEDRLLITPSGLYKMTMDPDDLIVIDYSGKLVEGKTGLRPSSESKMHLEAYHQRPDMSAVIHAHPPYATALTIAGLPFPSNIIPEVPIALGEVPTAPYATPGTEDLALSIRELIKTHNSVLLSHHGSISVGKTVEEALIGLERLENTARTFYLAKGFGDVIPLPQEEVARLKEIGRLIRLTH